MVFFFSKNFNAYTLGQVQYWKCRNCGFTISKTHYDLPNEAWQELNFQYHKAYQGKKSNSDDPNWADRLHIQALVLSDLTDIGLLGRSTRWLDFGCGDGKLSSFLKESYGIDLLKYDRYMPPQLDFLTDDDLKTGAFDFVLTTSVFEHFTRREDYDFVESLVSNTGTLGLHTFVSESTPNDPSWFYLLPVHCSFFTNKSMRILFEQWGYKASIYNVEARLWLWFKSDPTEIQSIIERANRRSNAPKYFFKNDFVDYWK